MPPLIRRSQPRQTRSRPRPTSVASRRTARCAASPAGELRITRMLDLFADAGGHVIDTADVYTNGTAR